MLLRLLVFARTLAGQACSALLPDCSLSAIGRVHISTTHPGIGGAPTRATASSRYSLGDWPTRLRNRALNEPRLEKPTRKQISVTDRFAVRRRVFARSIRRLVRYVRGGSPYAAVNARAK